MRGETGEGRRRDAGIGEKGEVGKERRELSVEVLGEG
jgi:hypothetical protein